ncbi:ABC transporter permease [Streptomyces sp. NPDC056161]|uniref:ABC transporter permease n=1 Tax=Streptomyces sp. NPDC056161 TaxID=3345732 RepID=UPI0035DB3E54
MNFADTAPDTGSTTARLKRVYAVFARNVDAARHPSYLWVMLSGVFEPAFYLASIGFGVGALLDSVSFHGSTVDYVPYVAASMLAASVMNGALAEATFNFFTKLRMVRLHDATALTPVSAWEVAAGEVMWSVAGGAVHSVPFLALMGALGLTDPSRLPVLFAACLLSSIAFSALGVAAATFLRGTEDFDRVNLIAFAMFLFSGTFVSPDTYPLHLDVLVMATPLWHAVSLTRDLAFGHTGWSDLGHVGYLVALAVLSCALASRRLDRLLHA